MNKEKQRSPAALRKEAQRINDEVLINRAVSPDSYKDVTTSGLTAALSKAVNEGLEKRVKTICNELIQRSRVKAREIEAKNAAIK